MRNPLIGWAEQPGSPITEASHAIRNLPGQHADLLLLYGPVARMNPYQALLYSRASEHSVAVSELIPLDCFKEARQLSQLSDKVAVHFHWINSVIGASRSHREARRRVDAFINGVDDIKSGGTKIIFTIHNKVSHDAKFLAEELRLQQMLLDRADIIHSMSFVGLESKSDFATIDHDRVLVAPHPLYSSVYPDFLPRVECRRALGLLPNEIALCMFGAIKPYKGLGELRSMWPSVVGRSTVPLRLIVAGAPDDSAEARHFLDWAINEPTVIAQPNKIPFEQVQLFVKAADFGLIPYRRTLNSGAALLHLTFGNPILAVDEPALVEGLDNALYGTFRDAKTLVDSIQRLAAGSHLRELAFHKLHMERSVSAVSDQFLGELKNRL